MTLWTEELDLSEAICERLSKRRQQLVGSTARLMV